MRGPRRTARSPKGAFSKHSQTTFSRPNDLNLVLAQCEWCKNLFLVSRIAAYFFHLIVQWVICEISHAVVKNCCALPPYTLVVQMTNLEAIQTGKRNLYNSMMSNALIAFWYMAQNLGRYGRTVTATFLNWGEFDPSSKRATNKIVIIDVYGNCEALLSLGENSSPIKLSPASAKRLNSSIPASTPPALSLDNIRS